MNEAFHTDVNSGSMASGSLFLTDLYSLSEFLMTWKNVHETLSEKRQLAKQQILLKKLYGCLGEKKNRRRYTQMMSNTNKG